MQSKRGDNDENDRFGGPWKYILFRPVGSAVRRRCPRGPVPSSEGHMPQPASAFTGAWSDPLRADWHEPRNIGHLTAGRSAPSYDCKKWVGTGTPWFELERKHIVERIYHSLKVALSNPPSMPSKCMSNPRAFQSLKTLLEYWNALTKA
ncbi:hypothetical protein PDIDSM_7434 [Penicillium digitatum]|nr:hypothetical protein PDIDSM_7434 [Penicillium digitatum]